MFPICLGNISCDNDQDGGRMRRSHRHTVNQIQELESFYKQNSYPTEDQRRELGQRLNMEANQIKFWFQNKRSQVKMNRDRLQNVALKENHDRLLGAQDHLRCAMLYSLCNICGAATNCDDLDYEVQKLMAENASLEQEISQYSKFLHDPIQLSEPLPSFSLMVSNPRNNATPERDLGGGTTTMKETSYFLDLAVTAMKELTVLGKTDSPYWWKKDLRSNHESLVDGTFKSVFNVIKPPGYVVEASKDMGLVPMTSLTLVKTLMDTGKWVSAFESIVSVASTRKLTSTGSPGTMSGSLQLIHAELFHVISPLVPKRQVTFLRYCKDLRHGSWVVVDVTPVEHYPTALSYGGAYRLPSGLIIKDMANGYSKVTWIEQAGYDESHIHQIYKPLMGTGIGLGAKRWLTTLQRHCETLSTNLTQIDPDLSTKGAAELVRLANRMTHNYYTGITGSPGDKWEILEVANVEQNMRFMTRKNVNKPGELTGIVLSAAISVRCPVHKKVLFAFLSSPIHRHEWDILTPNTYVDQTVLIRKAKRQENNISLLKISESGMLVLEEVWNDASGAMVVYAPVETNSMELVKSGENSDSVELLASGFSILPDGLTESDHKGNSNIDGRCLLTLGLQTLISSDPTAELTQGSVITVKELMTRTIAKINSALYI